MFTPLAARSTSKNPSSRSNAPEGRFAGRGGVADILHHLPRRRADVDLAAHGCRQTLAK